MLYVFICEDNENSLERRLASRASHLARLQNLKQEGRLVLAGPNPAIDNIEPGPAGFTGSIIVAEFDNLDDAKIWANNDPYLEAGVYRSVTVKPFNQVLP